jgi:peptidoglycan-associated lipoprotein
MLKTAIMMRPQRIYGVFAVLLFTGAASLAGCHSRDPASPNAQLASAAEPPRPPDLGRGAPRVRVEGPYNMYVAEPVRSVCSGTAPFFEFDSFDAREVDQPTMKVLAECMISGPLKGKTIKLIGHTDPRGTPDYNEKLGLERAERVRHHLLKHGVEAGRVQVDSVGEEAASPAPENWAKDRRVEIQLVQ